ncbi:MAG: ADP-ribosylglycohydrolase family protein [Candidatus Aminicenantales bacterium]
MPPPMDERIRDKFLGSMIGGAIGDAIGELAFRHPSRDGLIRIIESSEEIPYTDDTAMAIGVAESLIAHGTILPEALGRQFHANYRAEPWRGYGPGPPRIFRTVERSGLPYVEASRSLFGGQGSFGNGAAMRVGPVGLFFYDAEDLYEKASASALPTHAHPVGRDGAAVQAGAVAQAVTLEPGQGFSRSAFLDHLLRTSRTEEMQEKLSLLKTCLAEDVPPDRAVRILGRSVAVHESQPFALYAFLRHPDSFEECLLCAVLHGGDRDTIGAMAGAVSGAYLGVRAVPRAWREKIEKRSLLEALASNLMKARNRYRGV